ncbi:MAG: hypothetical protein EBY29_02635 [Planctomycetes bacterium]|nr:hypothetical protein [Planctomycetota bacterium]
MGTAHQTAEKTRAMNERSAATISPAIVGYFVFGIILLSCVASLPWTMGRVEVAGNAPVRRYEAGNLDLSLLAPSWWEDSQGIQDRIEVQRSANAYVPSRILGTDRLGRDVFARCLLGGAVSLLVGLSAALVAVGFGTLYGTTSAACGGRVDNIMMRAVDVLYGLPSMLLVVMFAVAAEGILERVGIERTGSGRQIFDLLILLLAIGATSWLTVARVIRGQEHGLVRRERRARSEQLDRVKILAEDPVEVAPKEPAVGLRDRRGNHASRSMIVRAGTSFVGRVMVPEARRALAPRHARAFASRP